MPTETSEDPASLVSGVSQDAESGVSTFSDPGIDPAMGLHPC